MASLPSTSAIYEDDNDDYTDETDNESSSHPPSSKKARKLDGYAKYPTKFRSEWKKEFNFITNVPGDPYRYTLLL